MDFIDPLETLAIARAREREDEARLAAVAPIEDPRELLKLLIDENPYSLKGAGGRVFPHLRLLAPAADDVRHERGKLSGSL